jgi:hypothetical protein
MADNVTSNFAARVCDPKCAGAPEAPPLLMDRNAAGMRARLSQSAKRPDTGANQPN